MKYALVYILFTSTGVKMLPVQFFGDIQSCKTQLEVVEKIETSPKWQALYEGGSCVKVNESSNINSEKV